MTDTERAFIDIAAAYIAGEKRGTAKGVDFADLSSLAYIHKMTPVIYSSLAKYYADEDGVKEYCSAVKKAALMQASSQIAKSRALIKAYGALSGQGIRAAVVKGIVLRSLWNDGDLRISSDEDLLVGKEDFDKAANAFISLGFEEKECSNEETNVRAFFDETSGLRIELHNSLFPHTNEHNEKMASFFTDALNNLEEIEIDGCKISTLSPTDSLLFLILHSFKHFIYCGFGLRQVCDFIVYARNKANFTNAEYIIDSLRQVRALGFFDGLLSICDKYFGVSKDSLGFASYSPSPYDTEDLMSDIISGGAYGNSSPERVHSSVMTVSSAGSGRNGGALRALFPPYEVMKERYPFVAKHKALLPFGWVKRIVTRGVRRGDSFSASKSVEIGRRRLDMLKKYGVIK